MTKRYRPFLVPGAAIALLAFGLVLERVVSLSAGTPKAQVGVPAPDPNLVKKVIDVQNRHTDALILNVGVVGTGTGLDDNGNVVINVYTNGVNLPLVPKVIEGIPVRVVNYGLIFPLAGPPAQRQVQTRPVPIGVSAGTSHGRCSTGTLGARLRGMDGKIYALSTNHVFADENQAPTQNPVLQPATADTACQIDVANNIIGRLFTFKEITFSLLAKNKIDAAVALAELDYKPPALVDFATLPDGYGAPEPTTVAATLGQNVQKYGRTTGLTQGIVTAVNVTAIVTYLHGPARFVGQIEVSRLPGGSPFADYGDSGALVVDSANHPVGLLFATGNRCALMNPIDDVLSEFNMTIDSRSTPPTPPCDCPSGCSTCDTEDLGYDPNVPEPVTIGRPDVISLLPLPPKGMVDLKFVPPPGGPQKTPNCFVWSSTYGLATFTAAKKGNYSPTAPFQQASSAYLYIDYLKNVKQVPDNCCTGGSITACLNKLQRSSTSPGGTPSMAQAPYYPVCCTLWDGYGSQNLQPDSRFSIGGFAAVSAKDPNLADIKQIIHSGRALVYGTHLYTDFGSYAGFPVPYVGNGKIAKKSSGSDVGHCMLIIGYDDTLGTVPNKGAFLIQNSFGPTWGQSGRVWIAYSTFSKLSQGSAQYITRP